MERFCIHKLIQATLQASFLFHQYMILN